MWKWGLPHHQTRWGGGYRTNPGKIGLSLVKWFFAHLLSTTPFIYYRYVSTGSTLPALYVPPPVDICSGVLYRSRRSRLSQNRRKPAKPAAYRRCWWTLFRNSKSGKRRRERRGKRERKGGRKGRKERKKVGSQKPIELRFWELIENKSNFKLVFSLHHVEGGCRREREFLPGSRDSPLVFWAVAHI